MELARAGGPDIGTAEAQRIHVPEHPVLHPIGHCAARIRAYNHCAPPELIPCPFRIAVQIPGNRHETRSVNMWPSSHIGTFSAKEALHAVATRFQPVPCKRTGRYPKGVAMKRTFPAKVIERNRGLL